MGAEATGALVPPPGRGEGRAAARDEIDLVRLGVRAFLGTAPPGVLDRALASPRLDPERVVATARAEGVAGILATALSSARTAEDVDRAIRPLRDELAATFVHNGRHLGELDRLGAALDRAGRSVIVLKGAALLRTAYGGRLGLRPLSDVDLLVRPEDVPLVERLLRDRGFRASPTEPGFFTKGPLAFDVHTDLVGRARVPHRGVAFRLDEAPLWERARRLRTETASLLVLDPVHELLHLAVHALKHSHRRLVWLVDLALVARRLDEASLVDEARRTGCERAAAYAATLLETVLGVRVGGGGIAATVRLNAVERFYLAGVARGPGRIGLGELVAAFSIDGMRARLAYLLELARPRDPAPAPLRRTVRLARRAASGLAVSLGRAARAAAARLTLLRPAPIRSRRA